MGRTATVFANIEYKCLSVNVPFRALPYLQVVDATSRGAAIRRCISDHASVAAILRDPRTSEAEKLAALYDLMPHALAALEKARTAQQPTDTETTDGTPTE